MVARHRALAHLDPHMARLLEHAKPRDTRVLNVDRVMRSTQSVFN
jgi:hypothetical protein